ncbi:response regulator [Desulfobacterales bacterium HSG17]|nr:response regulator [Desulfobacterales bacterium HSG17]
MKEKSVKILLIEDNPGDARLIREQLSEKGTASFDMNITPMLSEGLEALSMEKYDVILLDLGLPDSSGLDSLLRTHSSAPNVAIIVLTGFDDDELAVKAVQQGAQDYLVKDLITPDSLSRAIHYAMERKRADRKNADLEDRLRQTQKMEAIGTLAGGIAHDFNNILFPIFGYVEIMMGYVPGDSKLQEPLHEVLKAALRARELVKQILTFSRQSTQELLPLSIQLILNEVLKLCRSTLPSTIEICQNINKNCGLVMADPTRIHQVIMNLVTNAYHAMEETGGQLGVGLKDVRLEIDDIKDLTMNPGTYVCLSVSDTGKGMEKSVLDRIFEPYFTTKEKNKGTGLGLAIVHGIIKRYNGDIRVYSEPGKGTIFHVYLPVSESLTHGDDETIDTIIKGGNEHILFVDDEPPVVKMVQQMLAGLGYQMTAFTSGTEAFEAFTSNPDAFDLVMTDMTMPKITGVMLTAKILDIRPDIPIVICTGFNTQISKEKAKALGIKEYILKPIVRSELAHTIRKVLDGKNL